MNWTVKFINNKWGVRSRNLYFKEAWGIYKCYPPAELHYKGKKASKLRIWLAKIGWIL